MSRFGSGGVVRRLRRLPAAVGYLVVGGLTGVASLFAVVALAIVAAASLIGIGIPAWPEAVKLIRPLLGVERRRAGKRLGTPIVPAYQPLTGDLRHQLATLAADPANRRDLAWLVLHAIVGLPLAALAVALPLSAVQHLAVSSYWGAGGRGAVSSGGIVIDSWTAAVVSAVIGIVYGALALRAPEAATAQARVAAALLAPDENALLADRVAELTATRAAALDAHGAELRRIERDLHDGAQARIAAVIMQLGLAEQLRDRDSEAADRMVRTAQDTASAALAELRDVVRSVYPPVLSDRGLNSAVSALAARSPIPCVLETNGITRRPMAVEAAAYFVIAEAIANATKHSGAATLSIELGGPPDLLTVEIRDDGGGGARVTDGGGLAGIRRRAEALDGQMTLSSPAGGPTVVRVELPCGS
ncbi:sensor histidine kinase [Nocardia salmonicida]|uniref:sensor histidine kinase n=1 Tax=Nocardia salmonicida TaxID=53431 RepID=UPI002E2B5DC1|nr:sensor histidine kinase [Nocardia salmonicida]